ncbi:hypothetical protein AYI68_g626 [Smittium mucronatum]|uniref:Uncharacterized protein n=1 Tax=Smittium mucronatum TaxID=133383 RepID=A0A1R0H7N3_9FUNG|nr:hypothetical protein AYI68_g626 [Smittium mucronatum]
MQFQDQPENDNSKIQNNDVQKNSEAENFSSSIMENLKKDSNRSKVLRSIEIKTANIKKIAEKIKKSIQKNFLNSNHISNRARIGNASRFHSKSLNNATLNHFSKLYPLPTDPNCDLSEPESVEYPSYNELEDISLSLIQSLNIIMMPMKISDFLHKLKNGTFPDHFICSIIAVGIKFSPQKTSQLSKYDKNSFSNRAKHILSKLSPPYDLYYIWSCVLLSSYYFNFSSRLSVEFIGRAMM